MKKNSDIEEIYKFYNSDKLYKNKWSKTNLGNRLIHNERFAYIKKKLKDQNFNLKENKILEIGCASGEIINDLIRLGANEEKILGIDIRKESISKAKTLFPYAKIELMDASQLQFKNCTFDLVTAFTLFSSVLELNLRKKIAAEIIRVLKPNGIILFYDMRFNNPFNKYVLGIKRNELKKLFPKTKIISNHITLFPYLTRTINFKTKTLYTFLSKFDFLKTHNIAVIRKIK